MKFFIKSQFINTYTFPKTFNNVIKKKYIFNDSHYSRYFQDSDGNFWKITKDKKPQLHKINLDGIHADWSDNNNLGY